MIHKQKHKPLHPGEFAGLAALILANGLALFVYAIMVVLFGWGMATTLFVGFVLGFIVRGGLRI